MSHPLQFGIVRIADTLVGVDAAQLHQVVTLDAPPGSIPESGAAMVGTFVVRDRMVPVVDLRCLMGRAGEGSESAVPRLLVVIQSSAGLIGVLAHAVVKLTRVGEGSVGELHAGDDSSPRFFNRCFLEQGKPVFVLSEEVLASIPGVRFIDQASPQEISSQGASQKVSRPRLVFATTRSRFALDLDGIQSIEPIPEIENNDAASQFLRGFVRNRGRKVALGNLDQFLNPREIHAGVVPDPSPLMLVLSTGAKRLSLEISQVLGLEEQGDLELLPLQSSGVDGHAYCQGAVCSRQFGDVLVLDHAKILDAPDITSLAIDPDESFRTRKRAESDPVRGRPGERSDSDNLAQAGGQDSYLVFRVAQQSMAVDVLNIQAVLAAPCEMSGTAVGVTPGFRGITGWQGHPIPVVDTGVLLGLPGIQIEEGAARIIVVRDEDGPRGYLVDAIESLQRAQPRQLPIRHIFKLSTTRNSNPAQASPSMIGYTEAGQRRNVLVVDLRTLRSEAGAQSGAGMALA